MSWIAIDGYPVSFRSKINLHEDQFTTKNELVTSTCILNFLPNVKPCTFNTLEQSPSIRGLNSSRWISGIFPRGELWLSCLTLSSNKTTANRVLAIAIFSFTVTVDESSFQMGLFWNKLYPRPLYLIPPAHKLSYLSVEIDFCTHSTGSARCFFNKVLTFALQLTVLFSPLKIREEAN